MKKGELELAIKATTHVYVGQKRCGCNVALCVDIPGLEKETAKSVAEYIQRGYAVTRYHIVNDKEKATLKRCECNKQAKPQPLFQ